MRSTETTGSIGSLVDGGRQNSALDRMRPKGPHLAMAVDDLEVTKDTTHCGGLLMHIGNLLNMRTF